MMNKKQRLCVICDKYKCGVRTDRIKSRLPCCLKCSRKLEKAKG